MRHIALACLLLALAVAARAAQTAGVKVDVPAPIERVAAATGETFSVVSNVERIHLRVTVDTDRQTPPGTSPVPVYEIAAATIPGGKAVPVKQWPIGVNATPGRVIMDVLVELPLPAEERRRLVEQAVDSETAASTGQVHERLQATRQATIAALDRFFFQNRTGDYVITLKLVDPRWPRVASETRVRIVDKGTFADLLNRRDK